MLKIQDNAAAETGSGQDELLDVSAARLIHIRNDVNQSFFEPV